MRLAAVVVLLLAACSASRRADRETLPEPGLPARQASEPGSERPGPPETVPFPAGEALLGDRGLRGTFIVRRAGEARFVAAFPDLVDEPFVPASTFKIPNTLIGLETGVISDESFTLPWDGVERPIEAWNRDQDLTSALAESVVWYYQEVARRVGLERMREWVARLDYGNAEVGPSVDTFWLEGSLLITPREQVELLERLTGGELPVSARSVRILREVMPSQQVGGATVLAKTGTALRVPEGVGWLVGWVEEGGEVTAHFALLLLGDGGQVPSPHERWELAEELLGAAGVISSR